MSRLPNAIVTLLATMLVSTGVVALLAVPTLDGDAVGVAALVGLGFGLLYGLEAGILECYDLASGTGWATLLIDLTWSLPNTVVGFVLGNLVYVFVGNPSHSHSKHQHWVVFKPRGTGAFGNQVLQTIGTVNLGGAGHHERMHLLQARIFGPFFVPVVVASYIVTSLIQLLWTATLGWVLLALGARSKAWLEAPARSAVPGFFGWIYYATPFELWAYASGNP